MRIESHVPVLENERGKSGEIGPYVTCLQATYAESSTPSHLIEHVRPNERGSLSKSQCRIERYTYSIYQTRLC